MKSDLVFDVSKASNKTLKELKNWIEKNPINKAKRKIILKNKNTIICTNF